MATRFRLATLLKLREMTRDERRRALAQALDAAAILARQREQLEAEQSAIRGWSLDQAGPGRVDVDQCLALGRYQLLLQTQIAGIARQEKQVAEEIERRRRALTEADREVRTLEKLRERQEERERIAEERLDIKRFDEIAGQRFAPPEEVRP
jgi:flagellar export protein FliJ